MKGNLPVGSREPLGRPLGSLSSRWEAITPLPNTSRTNRKHHLDKRADDLADAGMGGAAVAPSGHGRLNDCTIPPRIMPYQAVARGNSTRSWKPHRRPPDTTTPNPQTPHAGRRSAVGKG